MSPRPTLVFAGGYTAGHITPGLAVIERLRASGAPWEFLFLGSEDGWERELVTQAGVAFAGLPPIPWAGCTAAERMLSLVRLAPSVCQARRRLRERQVIGVVGLGSFASVAPVLAARSLGLPVTLYEPNASRGLANRLLSTRAQSLLVSRLYAGSARGEAVQVGVPLRAPLGGSGPLPRVPPSPGRLRLLVLGGSRGNAFLNERLPALCARLRADFPHFTVVHQCGHRVAPGEIAQGYRDAGVAARVVPYADSIADLFAEADFVVSAAGAISLHEIAAAGVPALVVPLERGAGAHQVVNAREFAALTRCPAVAPSEWNDARVAAVIAEIARDTGRWRERQEQLRALHDVTAAERFAQAIAIAMPAREWRAAVA